MHGALLTLLCCIRCFSRLVMLFSGNLQSCLREVKRLVVFDGEGLMALDAIQGNHISSRVDLGCMEHFSSHCGYFRVPLDL